MVLAATAAQGLNGRGAWPYPEDEVAIQKQIDELKDTSEDIRASVAQIASSVAALTTTVTTQGATTELRLAALEGAKARDEFRLWVDSLLNKAAYIMAGAGGSELARRAFFGG